MTANGKPIADELVEKLADKAEAGYDVEETRWAASNRLGPRERRVGPPRP
jgi:hypothetical protein